MTHRTPLLAVLLVLLAGCGSSVAPLKYAPTAAVTPAGGSGGIQDVTADDQRGEADPTWYGAVRGGFGNSLKELHADKPIKDVVAQSFRDGLAARGMTEGTGPAIVHVAVTEFKCDQVGRREADVGFTVDVRDRASGRTLYSKPVQKTVVTGSILALDTGVFGSTDDLQAVAQTAMNQAIDAALDDPGFRAAVAGRRV